ncbi:MAG: hypothetical protein GYA16_12225 [Spirochaetes bacterium]|nr:hypothetical protein [Spirochaetota bacterium]
MPSIYGNPDQNQKEIVQKLRDTLVISVEITTGIGHGFPDLLVGFYSTKYNMFFNLLFEVKNTTGKLKKGQIEWHSEWKGNVYTIRSFDEAMEIINQYR